MNLKPLPLTGILMERRSTEPRTHSHDLAIETSWRPADRAPVAAESWLRENGYAPNRRRAPRS